jgi:hypothetical protein
LRAPADRTPTARGPTARASTGRSPNLRRSLLRFGWFVLLWAGGVATVGLVALVIRAAMPH